MEFSDNQNIGSGGGNMLNGLLAGSMLNRREDTHGTWMFAMIVFVIFIVLALIFLAFFAKDNRGHKNEGADIAAMLTPLIAAKTMDGNRDNKGWYDHDEHAEIKNQIAHSEDRRMMADVEKLVGAQGREFMQMGFGLSGQIKDVDTHEADRFAKVENQLGQLSFGLAQVLQTQNNEAIITGILNRLTMAAPCARC